MSKPILAIDADDTIYDENNALRLYINDHYGFRHTVADYQVEAPFETYWEDIWNVTPEKMSLMYKEFAHSDYKKELNPIKGALETLQKLKENYELVVVTSQGKSVVDITHYSLVKHYPDIFKDVHFVPLWGGKNKATKAQICNEIGASYLIDDSFEHCRIATEAGVKAIVFGDYGWNKSQELPEGAVRCQNRGEVFMHLGNGS
jgi:FMN phosphatase YigB (HAD superfamily)